MAKHLIADNLGQGLKASQISNNTLRPEAEKMRVSPEVFELE